MVILDTIMTITFKSTADYEVLIGEQVRQLRFRNGLDQTQLASASNISLGAVKNIESGKGSSLKTLVKILRTLNEEKWLETLSPKTTISPMQVLRDQKLNRPRQRVYKNRKDFEA